MNAFWARKLDELNSLAGLVVTELMGIEMAVKVSETDEVPIFADPKLPFVQLTVVYLKIADGSIRQLTTCASDDSYGIVVAELNEMDWAEMLVNDSNSSSIFRRYSPDGITLGRLEEVRAKLDGNGCVLQLELCFEGSEMALVAGEVIDEADGSLRYCKPEESILLFLSHKDVGRVPWYGLSPPIDDHSDLTIQAE